MASIEKDAQYIESGDKIQWIATDVFLHGAVVPLENMIGIIDGNSTVGSQNTVFLEGVWKVEALSTEVFEIGNRVYYDAIEKEMTLVSTDNTPAGIVVLGKLAVVGEIHVKINR